jgi:hypothetical protein
MSGLRIKTQWGVSLFVAYLASATLKRAVMASAYLDDPTPPDEALDSRARPYQEFLEDDAYNYHDEIVRMLNLDQTRLIVNLDDLRAYRRELATAYVLHHVLPPPLMGIAIIQPSQGASRSRPCI